MTIADLLDRARTAGLSLDAADGGLAVDGDPDDHPALMDALAINKGSVVAALTLKARLDTGWNLCQAEIDPARRIELEDHWFTLLREYEAVCDGVLAGADGT